MSEFRDDPAVDELRLLSLAQALVRAPGTNPPGEEAATVAALQRLCADADLDCRTVEVAPGRANVIVTLPGGDGPGLLILGHSDVVPVGDGWTVDPFAALVRDGRLFGRGSSDMKGGLAAALAALLAVRDQAVTVGATLTGSIELVVTVDEEEAGIGVRDWVAGPDVAADGYLGCIVAEPTDLQTVIAARGDAYADITVHGVAAHSGRPEDGRNAIHAAARVISSLAAWHGELREQAHPLVGPPTWSVGLIEGGQGTSIVAPSCRVQADRRLLPGEDVETVLRDLRARLDDLELDGCTLEVAMPMSMPGFETDAAGRFVAVVDHCLRAAGGPGAPLGGWTAACDGGFVARDLGVPVVVLGPGSVNDQAHRPDESVSVDELVVAARAYASAAWELLVEGAKG